MRVSVLYTSYVFSENFYTSSYGLTEVLTSTSMLIYEPLHLLPNIFLAEYMSSGLPVSTPIQLFLHIGLHTGLRTGPA